MSERFIRVHVGPKPAPEPVLVAVRTIDEVRVLAPPKWRTPTMFDRGQWVSFDWDGKTWFSDYSEEGRREMAYFTRPPKTYTFSERVEVTKAQMERAWAARMKVDGPTLKEAWTQQTPWFQAVLKRNSDLTELRVHEAHDEIQVMLEKP